MAGGTSASVWSGRRDLLATGGEGLSGHVFVFLNRRKNQVKLMAWTRGGFTITHKRLGRGTVTFARQLASDAKCVLIDVHELSMLLEGIDVERGRMSRRWEPASRASVPVRDHA